jgi:PKD repeat protein
LAQHATEWHWSFGDGPFGWSNDENPTHVYHDGQFDVNVIFTNGTCKDSSFIPSAVHVDNSPIASFMYLDTVPAGTVRFINTTVNNPADHVQYLWDFGGSSNPLTDTSFNTICQYLTNADHVVTLIASNSFGCSDTAQQIQAHLKQVILYLKVLHYGIIRFQFIINGEN